MKKMLCVGTFLLFLVSVTHSAVEIRGGLLVSAAPDTAVDMFGSGLSWGISVRKEFMPMLKLGVGFDSVFMMQSGIARSDLTDAVINAFVGLDNERYDVDYRMLPIYVEGMLDFPVIYAVAGMGIYPTWISIQELYIDDNGDDAEREIYSNARTRFGTFFGGGIRFEVDEMIIRFGLRYHVMKVHKEIMDNNISAFSADIGIEMNF